MRFLPPNRKAQGWVLQSAARSLNPMAVGYGPSQTLTTVLRSALSYHGTNPSPHELARWS
jgi:hypothetical protein